MNRRQFLTTSGVASLATVTFAPASRAAEGERERDYYELRQYLLASEDQKRALDAFLKEAAVPALNRAGIKPVGVFYPAQGFSPVYVLLRHRSLESWVTLQPRLAEDAEFRISGADYLNATAGAPAYKRIESSLLVAFAGHPHLATPVTERGRVFQLRTYESPSEKTGLKKIEMFNDAGEIRIFREVGLNPVFFGQALVGTKLPNLTYMLAFKSEAERDAAWKKFLDHPDWKRLRAMPEYDDKAILCGITNLPLVAAEYSQV